MRFRSRPKPFLDAPRREWQFDAYAWLLRNSDGFASFRATALVLPTEEFFPDRGMKGHAGVAALFRRVRDHAGMADWPCTVEPVEDVENIAPGESGRIPIFTYPRGERDPYVLVAGFATSFSRYLLSTFEEPPPAGESMHGAAVELGAVFLGFGVFLANSAVQRADFRLSEGEIAHALAMFCRLASVAPASMEAHLNPHVRKHVRLAWQDLGEHAADFARLRAIEAPAPREAVATQAC